jgi:hypothetical protein
MLAGQKRERSGARGHLGGFFVGDQQCCEVQ